jgi:hypothetical protein
MWWRVGRGVRGPLWILVGLALCACTHAGGVNAAAAAAVGSDANSTLRGSALISLTSVITGTTAGTKVTSTLVGPYDFRSQRGHLQLSLLIGQGPPIGPIDVLMIGPTTYQRVSPASAPGSQEGWMKIPTGAPSGQLNGDPANPTGTGGLPSPGSVLPAVQTWTAVAEVGQTSLEGIAVTQYRAKASISGKTTPIDVWIDGQHHLRRVAYVLSAGGHGASTGGSVAITLDLSGFGLAVQVTQPADNEIVSSP